MDCSRLAQLSPWSKPRIESRAVWQKKVLNKQQLQNQGRGLVTRPGATPRAGGGLPCGLHRPCNSYPIIRVAELTGHTHMVAQCQGGSNVGLCGSSRLFREPIRKADAAVKHFHIRVRLTLGAHICRAATWR